MPENTTPLINGRAYDWSMIEFNFSFTSSSQQVYGIKAIKWNRNRKVESNYGVGSQPISRGYGNWTYSASIDLDYATQVAFQEVSPDGTLMGLGEFDLIVHFAHPEDGRTVTTTIHKCIFSEDVMEANQDDTDLHYEFQLNPGYITPFS